MAPDGTSIFNLESSILKTSTIIGTDDSDSQKDEIATTSTNTSAIQTFQTPPSACLIMVYSKTFDGHYEVFESIARKYPLPFSSTTKCQTAGLTPETPIVVDFAMPFQWHGGFKDENESTSVAKKKKGSKRKKTKTKKSGGSSKSEGWGWAAYFQQHLQNSTARRLDNAENGDGGRYIYYANVLGLSKQSSKSILWKSYSFIIEASCDMWGNQFWKDWLAKDKKRNHCVFHRKHEKTKLTKSMEKRTCYLNPQFQHEHYCWFLPTIYPKFPKPIPPFTNTNPKLNICIGWKSMGKGTNNLRDDLLLVQALSNLSNNSNNRDVLNMIQVSVIGRNARVPEAFIGAKLDSMVKVHSNIVSFYEYQQLIATQCHALIPLVHPEQTVYFLTAPESEDGAAETSKTKRKGQGRLSGMIAQVIGNQIPSLVHGAVADIYQKEFTAPYFVYNVTNDGGKSFQSALEGLIEDYYSNRSRSSKVMEWT